MSFAIHLDSKFADTRFGENACVFYLADPIILPSDKYEFLVSVPAASLPLSHWVVGPENSTLDLSVDGEPLLVHLPEGNRSVDQIIAVLNEELGNRYEARYEDATNRLILETERSNPSVTVGPATTCTKLLGLVPGQSGAGSLVGELGVNLSGTNSIFVRSNLATRNRDPVSRAVSNILAKVPVTRNFNEIEFYSSRQQFTVSDRSLSLIVIYLTGDSQEQLDFHGSEYSLTLEFSIRKKEAFEHSLDYRISGLMNNELIPQQPNASPEEPPDEKGDRRGPKRG